ncbi:hypothetical protein GH5_08310 [Leishmania sp. Ghana 2012 LV757]|uniref:hypothetical protein n=1 Tax=Leishmania sp. Ghana 2012 LV757 TaxID=2803181 RepID=UPI001B6E1ED9|nr:hypothetical protein GH5_08310 [Leishmania sp. Ghana 2012 LV757]
MGAAELPPIVKLRALEKSLRPTARSYLAFSVTIVQPLLHLVVSLVFKVLPSLHPSLKAPKMGVYDVSGASAEGPNFMRE